MILDINNIQLTVARSVLNLRVRDLGILLHVSKTVITKHENNQISFKKFLTKKNRREVLTNFFLEKNISFPNNHSIQLISSLELPEFNDHHSDLLTRFQLKAARIITQQTQESLARSLGITRWVITSAEQLNNQEFLNSNDAALSKDLKFQLEERGVSFIDPFCISFKKTIANG